MARESGPFAFQSKCHGAHCGKSAPARQTLSIQPINSKQEQGLINSLDAARDDRLFSDRRLTTGRDLFQQ
jgi:hypothetical protein